MTEDTTDATDALGNSIIIGNKYGCSYGSHGWHHILIGTAAAVRNDKVILSDSVRKTFLYGEWHETVHPARAPSMRSFWMFPIVTSGWR